VFFGIVAQSSWRGFIKCAVQTRLLGLESFLLCLLDDDFESTKLVIEVDLDFWGQVGGFKREREITLEILRELVLGSDSFGSGVE
jgi:hypothetical protein